MAERKKYTEAEKQAAVAKVKELGITKASKELGIAVGSLNKWRTELAEIEAENAKKIKATITTTVIAENSGGTRRYNRTTAIKITVEM